MHLFPDEMQYAGQFRVLGGDFYHPALDDTQSNDFKYKAAHYQRMVSAPPGLTADLLRKREGGRTMERSNGVSRELWF